MRHTQNYFDLNPKPKPGGLIVQGLKFLGYAVWALVVVYVFTVVLFSF